MIVLLLLVFIASLYANDDTSIDITEILGDRKIIKIDRTTEEVMESVGPISYSFFTLWLENSNDMFITTCINKNADYAAIETKQLGDGKKECLEKLKLNAFSAKHNSEFEAINKIIDDMASFEPIAQVTDIRFGIRFNFKFHKVKTNNSEAEIFVMSCKSLESQKTSATIIESDLLLTEITADKISAILLNDTYQRICIEYYLLSFA